MEDLTAYPYSDPGVYYSAAEDGCLNKRTDFNLPPGMPLILFIGWMVCCAAGLGLIVGAKQTALGLILIGVPSFAGMVLSPTFALCLFMLILPTGAGLGIEGAFTVSKGIGIVLGIAFLFNLTVTRPQLRIFHKGIWVLTALTIWILLASMQGTYFAAEMMQALTYIQLLAMSLITYWIILSNGRGALRWALRSYVIGTIGAIGVSFMTGAAYEKTEGRTSSLVGNVVDANMLATIVGLAFLTAVYLLIVDRGLIWRLFLLATILLLPVMLIRIGSRGALLALVVTFGLPFLFVREIVRKPRMIFLGILIAMAGFVALKFFRSGDVDQAVAQRFTDISSIKESLDYRLKLVMTGADAAFRYPLGTTVFDYEMRTGLDHFPHNDIFFTMALYGIPAALLLLIYYAALSVTIRAMDFSIHKYYARAVLMFVIITSMNIVQLKHKHMWIFLIFVFILNAFYRSAQNREFAVADDDHGMQEYAG